MARTTTSRYGSWIVCNYVKLRPKNTQCFQWFSPKAAHNLELNITTLAFKLIKISNLRIKCALIPVRFCREGVGYEPTLALFQINPGHSNEPDAGRANAVRKQIVTARNPKLSWGN